ncbi:hypothetical protein EKH57_05540 [Halorubrum sp. BOL3-1]|uniref:hypothetical protein n=1 Tax=Halorubrum sp. BOL3-1 TaxID=2497325 RepID=UPI0010052369|nr:hypothetical protein [Halorubrum sp. BOL3-1]QAU12225.1 hypothetical protein EKH57_05540 [Halorubrum sp. BOL3-1]
MTDIDDGGGSTGPPDRQILQLFERRLSSHPLVSTTAFDPGRFEPRRLQIRLDSEQFPDTVSVTRLDIQWFTTDDFSIHYVESHTTETEWECRWDRHPNEHNTRLHFHRPPNSDDVTDLSLDSTHPMDVYATVLAAVEQRLANCWGDGPALHR